MNISYQLNKSGHAGSGKVALYMPPLSAGYEPYLKSIFLEIDVGSGFSRLRQSGYDGWILGMQGGM